MPLVAYIHIVRISLFASDACSSRANAESSCGWVWSRVGRTHGGVHKPRPTHSGGALFGDGSLVFPTLSTHPFCVWRYIGEGGRGEGGRGGGREGGREKRERERERASERT